MLDAVRHYLQDWSDACEYANECAPDLTFLGNGEPFTALLFIAAVCFVAYSVNEARIARRVHVAVASAGTELKGVVTQLQQARKTGEKLAA